MRSLALVAGILAAGLAPAARAGDRFITLASTTSTENSGLFAAILPRFQAATGIGVHVVAVGTGQALRIARRGDADVLLVHDRPSEERFVAEGFGVERHLVMYNDFVLVGPREDPAGVRGPEAAAATHPTTPRRASPHPNVAATFVKIAARRAPFVSRADDSGTHKAELRLWRAAGIDPRRDSGTWYRETGSGMGATLNTAAAMGAYTLSDRGTWLAFRNRRGLEILLEGDERLHNPYGAILVNAERFPFVKAADGQAFIDWLLSAEGQSAIAGFRVEGEQLFHPAAAAPPTPESLPRD